MSFTNTSSQIFQQNLLQEKITTKTNGYNDDRRHQILQVEQPVAQEVAGLFVDMLANLERR